MSSDAAGRPTESEAPKEKKNDIEKSPRVAVTRLTLNSGDQIDLSGGDILLVVGPNNSGKSVFLRDICSTARNAGNSVGRVVTAVGFERIGSGDDFERLIRASGFAQAQGGSDIVNLEGWSGELHALKSLWSSYERSFLTQPIFTLFGVELTSEGRLLAANPVGPPTWDQGPRSPTQFLYRDDGIEERFSSYFREAFGADLVVNRLAGNQITLHCGRRPKLREGENLTSARYIGEVMQLPTAHTQGDGVRAFLGIILYAFTGDKDLVVIDEPEAFLHPPQARLLGRMLVTQSPAHRQLLMATHSTDFLLGVLSAAAGRVRLLRITREGDKNQFIELSRERLHELWRDPLLRYSKALDGLFHDAVIVCEADSDCRFYQAIADASLAAREVPLDAMFVHCGGKHRMPVLVKALRGVGVSVRVAVDFDVLSDENPLKPLVDAFGGDWPTVERDWRVVKAAIEEKLPGKNSEQIKTEISAALATVTTPQFPRGVVTQIQRALRRSSPWSIAKEAGKAFVPPGTATQTYERLIATLGRIGIHVVETGELESFDRTVGNHGPEWVNEVIKKDLASDPGLQPARDFVVKLVGPR